LLSCLKSICFICSNLIPPEVINKIFDIASIEEVVGEYVTLKRAGANFKGLCPFHDDKSPSMSVSPSKGIFKCFSCGEGGNIFQFIMQHEGLSYPLAIKFLANKYNIEIDEGQIDVDELKEEARIKDGVYACLEFAKNHFHERLNLSQDGKVIYKPYLTERGINQPTIDHFHIGLSGTQRDHLLQEGIKNGYTSQQLFDAGLVKKINDDQPKYLNSPETVVYEKRKELYGLNLCKQSIRKNDAVFLVEGYMDVVSLHQNGVDNVVAASGTAFTEEQARLIKRFTHQVTMLFDGDTAGVNASLKHIHTLLSADINVQVVLFPADEDPDSFIQKRGSTAFHEYVKDSAKNFVELIQEVKLAKNTSDPIQKAEAARLVSENIAALPDPLKRAAFISETSSKLDIPEQIIIAEVNKFRVNNRKQKDREERRSQQEDKSVISQGPPSGFEYQPDYKQSNTHEFVDSKNYQEEELLKTLILHADKEFSEDLTVAEFIFNEFEEEQIWPISEDFRQIFRDAHTHLKEHKVLNELYFIRNAASSKIAAEVLSVRHNLSKGWENNYEKFVKSDQENYKSQVIDNLNYLKLKHIDLLMKENQEKLKIAETEEDIMILQQVHDNLLKIRQKITDQSGTVIS